nr:MAG: hypothetical protein DIU80_23245 [Chloroflexota bacterium]
MAGTAYTNKDLKAQVARCGSHYFDPSTMRFFNSRLISVYPVPGRNMTYFVEGKGGGDWESIERHYTIGVFKNCKVQSFGGAYRSSSAAKKVAAAIARKAAGGGASLKRRRRTRR